MAGGGAAMCVAGDVRKSRDRDYILANIRNDDAPLVWDSL